MDKDFKDYLKSLVKDVLQEMKANGELDGELSSATPQKPNQAVEPNKEQLAKVFIEFKKETAKVIQELEGKLAQSFNSTDPSVEHALYDSLKEQISALQVKFDEMKSHVPVQPLNETSASAPIKSEPEVKQPQPVGNYDWKKSADETMSMLKRMYEKVHTREKELPLLEKIIDEQVKQDRLAEEVKKLKEKMKKG